MKPTNTLHKYKTLFLATLHKHTTQFKLLAEACFVSAIAAAIWYSGPAISFFAQPEKRLYLIIFCCLLWVLKLLIIDLDAPHAFHFKDGATRKKLKALQSRFDGVLQFLKQTSVTRHGTRTKLNQLPWYLLIGPSQAGKTSLLANSKVHYVLQRQFQGKETQNIAPSEQCDWWVTRDISIIDVPGKYLAIPTMNKRDEEKPATYVALFQSLLRLIKKHRGKNPLEGIIIALPLPEIMKQGDPKKYQIQLRHLFLRIADIQETLNKPVPCYIAITKCDQLTGFSEFFAETSDEEIMQTWGVSLQKLGAHEKPYDALSSRFDMLIKKLNQQLLYRLHQERNPLARPYIKDFPLQVERLKECALDFVKRFSNTQLPFSLQGIYLTSALQVAPEVDNTVIEAANSTERSLQLFKEPNAASRAYFIKHFLLHGLTHTSNDQLPAYAPRWIRRSAYAASVSVITLAAIMFGKDFEVAIKQAYAVQNTLSDYQLAIQQSHDADEQLLQTLALLNHLEQNATPKILPIQVSKALTFYSNKSEIKSIAVYHHALQHILIPELKRYLGENLKKPVNKSADQVYGVLKSYLMLGEPSHFQAEFIENTLRDIAPRSLSSDNLAALLQHVRLALNEKTIALNLDEPLIQQTRNYLIAMPSFQLSYIILQNINSNNTDSTIRIGTPHTDNNEVEQNRPKKIASMFTAKAFTPIFSQETVIAAQEALQGNWVLGNANPNNNNQSLVNSLLEQLRTTYINNYVSTWEGVLSNMRLPKSENLAQTDALVASLVSTDSPLLHLLQTLHDNTYFEPITVYSPKLQNIGLLVDKNNEESKQLYQIFSGLQSLHQYLNNILSADNERKAAFEAVSQRMQHPSGELDVITQLRLIADKSPEPIKNWLNKITNDAWKFLVQDATRYMDVSWQEQVSRFYEVEIENHYPFSQNATQEVALSKFTTFFGNPGTLITFYNNYLEPFVDKSTPEWRWKSLDNQRLPFSDETLRQIQTAYHIHHMFFPNNDDKLHVQFALQPMQLGKLVKSVHVRINDKNITDQSKSSPSPHLLSWPNNLETKMTSIQLTLVNQKKLNRDYPGDWGWFKLINQSLVSTISNKQSVVNFSENDDPVKYILFTQGQRNPFLSLNLQSLQLPKQLSDKPRATS